MPVLSAGLLAYRRDPDCGLQVLIVHPGGPFWARRDLGAWSIPKGEHAPDEDAHDAALREFAEELGVAPPVGPERFLGEHRQPGADGLADAGGGHEPDAAGADVRRRAGAGGAGHGGVLSPGGAGD